MRLWSWLMEGREPVPFHPSRISFSAENRTPRYITFARAVPGARFSHLAPDGLLSGADFMDLKLTRGQQKTVLSPRYPADDGKEGVEGYDPRSAQASFILYHLHLPVTRQLSVPFVHFLSAPCETSNPEYGAMYCKIQRWSGPERFLTHAPLYTAVSLYLSRLPSGGTPENGYAVTLFSRLADLIDWNRKLDRAEAGRNIYVQEEMGDEIRSARERWSFEVRELSREFRAEAHRMDHLSAEEEKARVWEALTPPL